MILAIDPGPEISAFVTYDGRIHEKGMVPNPELLARLGSNAWRDLDECAIEKIASYGMAVGADVFETCVWTGRYIERWYLTHGRREPLRITRNAVKNHLCHSSKATDANVRAALIDMFGQGRGKEIAIGRKAAPGPLFGVTDDVWAALAVAVTASETILIPPRAPARPEPQPIP